jgi:2'-5' RNA ligase
VPRHRQACSPPEPIGAIRAFVAVALPPALQRQLAEAAAPLREVARGVAWVSASNYHLTLKFLGQVEEDRAGEIAAALATAAAEVAPFDLTLRGMGAFPTAVRARVIWAGVDEGTRSLAALAAAVERALAGLGFPAEARGFSAHVTLGRVREPRPAPALAEALARAAGLALGAARVDRVVLMRSRLSPRGAQYTELAAPMLAGRP